MTKNMSTSARRAAGAVSVNRTLAAALMAGLTLPTVALAQDTGAAREEVAPNPGYRVLLRPENDLPITIPDSLPTPSTAATPPRQAEEAPRQFVRDRLIVRFAPSTDVAGAINAIIADQPEAANGTVDATVQQIIPGLAIVDARNVSAGANAQDGSSAASGDPINAIIAENDPQVAELASTKVLSRLEGRPGILSVRRDYILTTQFDLNRIIQGEDETEQPSNARSGRAAQDRDLSGNANNASGDDGGSFDRDLTGLFPAKPAATPPAAGRVPRDRLYGFQWHYHAYAPTTKSTPGITAETRTSAGASNFPTAWAKSTGSQRVTLAVVDTGLAQGHPDIDYGARVLRGYDFVSAAVEFANDGAPGRDDNVDEPTLAERSRACPGDVPPSFHGTHVAGIAGAVRSDNGVGLSGGAWAVRILPVRVLNTCGSGAFSDILQGVLWAAGIDIPGVPRNETPADIVNLSLGSISQTGCLGDVQLVVDTVRARGVTVVAAAGNDGVDVKMSSVASCRGVISVGANDARGVMTGYSNYGATLDIMAPGGDTARDDNGDDLPDGILSTVRGSYGLLNGTSMASPVVAAAAALLKSRNPRLGPDAIERELKALALPRTQAQCPNGCGAGLLQADVSQAFVAKQ